MMNHSSQSDKTKGCCDDHSSHLLTIEDALQQIENTIQAIDIEKQIPIRDALNGILAEDVRSQINVPEHINSAMDGYAILGSNLPKQGTISLSILGIAYAGVPFTKSVKSRQCVQIFTGAALPEGTDTVIMQEHVKIQDNQIIIGAEHQTGQHVRSIGNDIRVGEIVLKKGKKLHPADIGLLASLGIPEVKIKRRLRVAFFSTGDELCSVGETPKFSQIYDSNRYTLHGMLTRLNCEITDMGIVRDDPKAIENTLLSAANHHDVVLTSGGVSVGAADYVTEILQRVGEMNFWKVAIKPGKPLAFGKIKNAIFFGLPGNPVSVMGTFYQIVQPALHRLMGQAKTLPFRFKVRCVSNLKKKAGRMDFQRGVLEMAENGEMVVRSTGAQGSSVLSSMSQANCFIVLPLDSGNISAGSEVVVEPFEGLV